MYITTSAALSRKGSVSGIDTNGRAAWVVRGMNVWCHLTPVVVFCPEIHGKHSCRGGLVVQTNPCVLSSPQAYGFIR